MNSTHMVIALLFVFAVALLPWHWLIVWLKGWLSACAQTLIRMLPQRLRAAVEQCKAPQQRMIILSILGALCLAGAGLKLTWFVLASLFVMVTLILPVFRAMRLQHHRQLLIIAALPAQLDLLAMLLSSGMPLLSSFQYLARGERLNPLQLEFKGLLQQVRAGMAIEVAMTNLHERYPCRELSLFCHAIQHSRESGASLATILQQQAEQRRQELFLLAERKAMEAPVKLMFPLLVFIFPATIVVLVVTLAAKVMWGL